MQSHIESHKDYEYTIKGDVLELIPVIKEHCISYQSSKYQLATILDSIRNLLNLRQKKDENLQDYTRQFKTVMQLMENQMGGPLFIPNLPILYQKRRQTV